MIKRIVKLTFAPEKVKDFLIVFEEVKERIRTVDGCHHMELLKQTDKPNVMFTLSIWEDEAALDAYRQSTFFADTWAKTKACFGGQPEAWSVEVVDEPI